MLVSIATHQDGTRNKGFAHRDQIKYKCIAETGRVGMLVSPEYVYSCIGRWYIKEIIRSIENSPMRKALSPQPSTPLFHSVATSDVDQLTDLMEGWDSDWRQLETGQSINYIDTVAGKTTVLQNVRLSHAIHQQGTPPRGLVTFGIPRLRGPSLWRGRESNYPGIFDFNAAGGYDCISGRGFDGLTLSLPRQKFAALTERFGLDLEYFLDGRVWEVRDEGSSVLDEFHRYLQEIFERATITLDPAGQFAVQKQLDEQLPDRLFFAMASHTQGGGEQPLKARQKGLRQAIEFMEEHCYRSPGIPEVCVSVGLSWRSLDRAFKECFGIGPKRYLLNLRLTRARRALKRAEGRTKVVDVANEWGFWHMGDFAREYRRMFGELPARTLAKQS